MVGPEDLGSYNMLLRNESSMIFSTHYQINIHYFLFLRTNKIPRRGPIKLGLGRGPIELNIRSLSAESVRMDPVN